MGKTSIEWCDHSINPIRARLKTTGAVGHYCEKISAGCANCYASNLQRRFQMPAFGSGQYRDQVEVFLDESKLAEVQRRKKPTRYFWGDMTDLFGDFVTDEWLDRCFDAMWMTPWHTHLLLTKRPNRMVEYVRARASRQSFGWTDIDRRPMKPGDIADYETLFYRNDCGYACGDWGCNHPLSVEPGKDESCHKYECPIAENVADRESLVQIGVADDHEFDQEGFAEDSDWMRLWRRPRHALPGNVWFGFSAENQEQFEQRAREFRPMRWVSPYITLFCSIEPLLGPINTKIKFWDENDGDKPNWSALSSNEFQHGGAIYKVPYLNWVIVGGESGPNARPCFAGWVADIVDQCSAANVPCFVKQFGSKPMGGWVGERPLKLKDSKGGDPNEWADDLRVRQFPKAAVTACE